MPFASRERRRAYMREYMRERYALEKAFREKAELRAAKRVMRLALNRLERARRKALENPNAIDERELSLGWQYGEVERETKDGKLMDSLAPAHNRRGQVKVGVLRWQRKRRD